MNSIKRSQVREPEYFISQTIEEAEAFHEQLIKEHEPQTRAFEKFLKTIPKIHFKPKLHPHPIRRAS